MREYPRASRAMAFLKLASSLSQFTTVHPLRYSARRFWSLFAGFG